MEQKLLLKITKFYNLYTIFYTNRKCSLWNTFLVWFCICGFIENLRPRRMSLGLRTFHFKKFVSLNNVDLGRIELPSQQCECYVLPLNHRPLVVSRGIEPLFHPSAFALSYGGQVGRIFSSPAIACALERN